MNFRVGFGFDVHRLKDRLDFWLGGIKIPHSKGALGHSDADVLIHSICDALLGAANLGDIGKHFPDTDPKYKGIDSKILLKEVMVFIRAKGYELVNIDSTIILQSPTIKSYIKALLTNFPCGWPMSIKATTTDSLGFIGEKKGIAVITTCLLEKL